MAFGYVLNSVLSIDSKETFKEDLKKCLSLVNEYRAKKLLPYTDFIRVGNYQMEKLLSNILSLSDMSEIEEMNKSTIMFEVFGILNHAMSKLIQLVADACARQESASSLSSSCVHACIKLPETGLSCVPHQAVRRHFYHMILPICLGS
ncbi:unnamed protein product [Trichobilharzia regenti]|nr:unnamed protein product [Trichobilharzia regenti]